MDPKSDNHQLLDEQFQPLLAKQGVSCMIEEDKIDSRKEMIDLIAAQRQGSLRAKDHHILQFEYSSDIAHLLLDFVIKEQACCSFFDFDLVFRKEQDLIEFHISSEALTSDKLDQAISMMIKK